MFADPLYSILKLSCINLVKVYKRKKCKNLTFNLPWINQELIKLYLLNFLKWFKKMIVMISKGIFYFKKKWQVMTTVIYSTCLRHIEFNSSIRDNISREWMLRSCFYDVVGNCFFCISHKEWNGTSSLKKAMPSLSSYSYFCHSTLKIIELRLIPGM